MANQVLIAHTGQRLQLDFTQFTSLDDFRTSVTRQTSIPPDCIIALTAQGKPLRLAAFQTEKELYVYDARTTQANAAGAAAAADLEIPLPKRFTVANPPNELRDQRSLAAWQELFHARQQWAAALADDCASKSGAAQERYIEMDAMMRCLDAAVANLEAVVKGIEAKYTEIKKWGGDAQTDYGQLVGQWEQYLGLARNIPIAPAMLRFMTGRDTAAAAAAAAAAARIPATSRSKLLSRQQQQPATLEDLVDLETAKKAGKLAPAALRRFSARLAELERMAPELFQGCEKVLRGFEQTVEGLQMSHEGDSVQLLQDIKAVANKIDTDYQTTLEYAEPSTRDVLQASKIAATHTERLLPSLKNRAVEMDEMYRFATRARNALAGESVDFMRRITELTSLSSDVKAQLGAVSNEEDMKHFDYLRLVQQLPFVYASFVSEAIKRREWLDKVKTDSSTLANEMALFHDEEVKRRKKWQKSVGNLAYGPPSTSAADNQVAGLEVNLLGEEAEWPTVTRADLDDLYDVLQRQKAGAFLIEDIGKMMAELKTPTKQQSKRIKAFKNGSVHEAALGRSGLLIRGDDDVLRSLQDDKGKLESKLKTAESRVRRLEDLLHRQSQASRASIGGVFQPPPSQHQFQPFQTASTTDRSETSHEQRRSIDAAAAAAAAAAELRMAQKVQQLETELAAEKERSAGLDADLAARALEKSALLVQMGETNSTKKDLLENLEALKREFTEERKSLEGEIKRLQARIEDTEDEMEHFGESRENEKASYDEREHALHGEIERLTKEHRDDTLKNQGQVEFLRKETKIQRERTETLERQLQEARDEVRAGAALLQKAGEAESAHVQAFRDLHGQLATVDDDNNDNNVSRSTPTDVADLIEAVSGKLADTLSRLQTTASDMALVKADLERSEAANEELRGAAAASAAQLAAEEESGRRLRESLAEGKARMAALEEELGGSREELGQLRAKIADGETGSETLRRRLEEEEHKVLELAEEVAAKQSLMGGVEEELRLFRERHEDGQAALAALAARLDARTLRAKDLSQRLYTQNDRLVRLLERLGFAVARGEAGGDSLSIQRVPRAERSALISASVSNGNALAHANGTGGEPAGSADATGASMLRKSSGAGGSRLFSSTYLGGAGAAEKGGEAADLDLLYWMNSADAETEADQYAAYMAQMGSFDIDAVAETVYRRVKEVEHIARKLQRDVRSYRDKAHALQKDAHDKIAFKHFKEGDLALFLPTRNQTNGAWAAFNIGFPHYFLREQEAHRLQNREWLVARIARVQEKVVDLSRSLGDASSKTVAGGEPGDAGSLGTPDNEADNDNPFDLSDGLRWYLIDAQEDKPGAPATPGLGKSTVAANNVEAVADIHTHARTGSAGRGLGGTLGGLVAGGSGHHGHRPSGIDGVSKTLSRSLESRRSSTSSRKAVPVGGVAAGARRSVEMARSPPGPAGALAGPSPAGAGLGTSPRDTRETQPDTTPRVTSSNEPEATGRNGPETTGSNDPDETTQQQAAETDVRQLQREESTASKQSVVWDSLWAVDCAESGKK